MKNIVIVFVLLTGIALSTAEAQTKKVKLFNDKDLKGWYIDVPKMDQDTTVKSPFLVRDGMLISLGTPRGHIITDKVFTNYRLQLEFRFPSTPGNTGVLVHVSKMRVYNKMFPQSIEVQGWHQNVGDFYSIVDDITVPDMVARRGPKETWGGTEGKNRRMAKLVDAEKPAGEWNTMIIECFGREIKVWLNNTLVNYGFDCTAEKGQIALQSEGSEVEFRNIFLIPIKKLTDK